MTGSDLAWEEVAPRRLPPSKCVATWRPLVGPALLLAAAALLAVTHHPRRAVAALVGGVILGVVLLASRRLRTIADRSVQRATPAVAVWLSWLLLTPVYFLVVAPVGVALRSFGNPPVDVARDPDRGSYWSVRVPRRRSRPDRLFAGRARLARARPLARQGRQVVLRTAVAVVLVEGLLVGGFTLVQRRRT